MKKLSDCYFKDNLLYPFEKGVASQLRLVLKITNSFDPDFADCISSLYGDSPSFALPWLLTWFSHSMKSLESIQRLFDFLISSSPYSILYVCAAVILISKDEVLATSEELDLGAFHFYFQKLEIKNIELVISTTIELEKRTPIESLLSEIPNLLPLEYSLVTEFFNHSLAPCFCLLKKIFRNFGSTQKERFNFIEEADINDFGSGNLFDSIDSIYF